LHDKLLYFMDPDTPLTQAINLDEQHKTALERLELTTVRDLLYHFPTRYVTVADAKQIASLQEDDHALLYGKMQNLSTAKSYNKDIPMAEGTLVDDSGAIDVVWFNQPYIAKMLKENQPVRLEGNVQKRNDTLYLSNPEYEKIDSLPHSFSGSLFENTGEEIFSVPIYAETRGVTSKWFYHTIKQLLTETVLDNFFDPIPQHIRNEYNIPDIAKALVWIHTPKKQAHMDAAKKRFSFEEIFFIQLYKHQQKRKYTQQESFIVDKDIADIQDFIDRFGFEPTGAQTNAIEDILQDFADDNAMSRLLEGDVGSGKTAVAAATAYAIVTTSPKGRDFGNLQVAYMAPTEILATQHFESFIEYFSHLSINIGLITSSGCKKFPSKVNPTEPTDISRTQLLKWVKESRMAILIGTHSLIQKSVEFNDLAYVIIDEQHRFGVKQRAKLQQRSLKEDSAPLPHLLSMTATPIPRTLALTLYGDLDISLIDELPPGRTYPHTELVSENERTRIEKKIESKLQEGRQAYVVCPRIDEPDPDDENALDVKSVEAEQDRLEDVYADFTVAQLHGKMKPDKKEEIMNTFNDGKIDILVSTTVIEVGVNVPNATTMVIENAERFGLAQLHQLRGRIMRSSHTPHCFVFVDSSTEKTKERMQALQEAENGFELAEEDLHIRGPGALAGTRQSGISDTGMEALKNIKMVEAARSAAKDIINNDPSLENFPVLKELLDAYKKRLHLE